MLTVAALGLLVLTAGFGAASLLRWLRRRRPGSPFPRALVVAHLVVAVVAVGVWITYLATDRLPLAWITLGVVVLGNALGDLVLAGRWRSTSTARLTLAKDYLAAVRDLTHPRRRINAAHFALAGVTTAAVLAACLVETL